MSEPRTSFHIEVLKSIITFSVNAALLFFTVKWIAHEINPRREWKKKAMKKAQEQIRRLGINQVNQLSDYELEVCSQLIDPNDMPVMWDDIAGLDDVIQELREAVILPIRRQELFQHSRLGQPPKGVLLYGPPGCGKTMVAKATAREAGTRFINLDVSTMKDMWYGQSQKLTSALFTLATKLQPCIIFIDEIDSFLRSRNSLDHEVTALIKSQFMCLWDGLATDPKCTVIIMGATNRPHDLDSAILRRMPVKFHIDMPNVTQRQKILQLILEDESTSQEVDINRLAKLSEEFSGSDLREMCRSASQYRVRDYIRMQDNRSFNCAGDGEEEYHDALRPIAMADLVLAMHKINKSKLHCGTFQEQKPDLQ